MFLYPKILVAIDCSPVDEAILKHIIQLALQNNSKVYLIHVVHSHTIDQDRVLRSSAEKTLSQHCEMMKNHKVQANIIIRSGEPDDEIVKEVQENDYDLIAMATHGHSFFGDLLFGSVSRTLKHKVSIPLLLIGPDQK